MAINQCQYRREVSQLTFASVLRLFVACFFSLIAGLLHAASTPVELYDEFSIKGLTVYESGTAQPDGNRVVVDLHMAASVWTLLGEPVYLCTAWWDIKSIMIDGMVVHGESTTGPQLPKSVLDKIRLWDGGFQIPVRSQAVSGTSVYLRCDTGEFWGAGQQKASFNVPASPGWNKLFFQNGQQGFTVAHTSDTAKSVMLDPTAGFDNPGGRFNALNVLSLKVDMYAAYQWLYDKKKQAYDQALAAPKQQPGQVTDDFEALFAEVQESQSLQQDKANLQAFQQLVNRAASLSNKRRQAEKAYQQEQCNHALRGTRLNSFEKYVALNKSGFETCETAVVNLIPFYGENDKFGFKNEKGEIVIPAQFALVHVFREGLAAVCVEKINSIVRTFGPCGFIDHTGRWVIGGPENHIYFPVDEWCDSVKWVSALQELYIELNPPACATVFREGQVTVFWDEYNLGYTESGQNYWDQRQIIDTKGNVLKRVIRYD